MDCIYIYIYICFNFNNNNFIPLCVVYVCLVTSARAEGLIKF